MTWIVRFGHLGDPDAIGRGAVIANTLDEALLICKLRLEPSVDAANLPRGAIIEKVDGYEHQ